MSDSTKVNNASNGGLDNDAYNRDVLLQQANDPKMLSRRNLLNKRWNKDAFGSIGKPMHPVGAERGAK